MSRQTGSFGRLVCFVVLVSFFPSSIAVWNFVPVDFGVARAETPTGAAERVVVSPDNPCLTVREHDVTLPLSDSESMSFERIYVNDNGTPQPSDTARLGAGWRHSLDVSFINQPDSQAHSSVKLFYEGEPDKGKLTKVQARDNAGMKLVLRYDDKDRLTKAAVMEDRTESQAVTYGYDEDGRLAEATGNNGKSVRYEYENIGSSVVMTRILDDGGSRTDIAWTFADDAKGVATKIEITRPTGERQAYEHNSDAVAIKSST